MDFFCFRVITEFIKSCIAQCQVKYASLSALTAHFRLICSINIAKITDRECLFRLFLIKVSSSIPAHIDFGRTAKTIKQIFPAAVGKYFQISRLNRLPRQIKHSCFLKTVSSIIADKHQFHRKPYPIRNRPYNIDAIR